MESDIRIRDARDSDAEGLIALIGGAFAEYPGCLLDVENELPELRAIASAFRSWGGQFWVAERHGVVVGSIGYSIPSDTTRIELRKLYVHKSARRHGLGSTFCDLVEAEARRRHLGAVELWSDTRFLDAHRLYEKRGYVRGAETRALHDISHSIEFYFRKDLHNASDNSPQRN